ncbi:MAG TPA: type III-B CRISPR module RAMP protein Cmr1 [Smithellaceae bacterium]|nr:type III-B CRISPR module RAMP protein Cmr1 [Smithellaceae bacterium]HRS90265.1 type III-B CRISPR module RAMP protein Cmr1 [Smithellaceae bacterium]
MFYISRLKDIKEMEYECEIVTPMFLGGAEPRKAELRVPPLKGALRFWWRALNPQTISSLKKEEASIFGDAGETVGKSRIKMGIIGQDIRIGSYQPLPHHSSKPKNFLSPCLLNGKFTISFWGSEKDHTLFKIFCFLGGVGKRSRRGFGSIKINSAQDTSLSVTKYNIFDLINNFQPGKFKKTNENEITRIDYLRKIEYACIKKILIGKEVSSRDELLKKIGLATHHSKSDYLGFVKGQSRFASPVYVTINKTEENLFYPVITWMNCAAPAHSLTGADKTDEFIKAVLS